MTGTGTTAGTGSTGTGATGTGALRPLEPPYDPVTAEQLERWRPPGLHVEPLALLRLLARHPGLLPPRDRELLLCRSAVRAGSDYAWGVHAATLAPQAGLSPEVLDALARPGVPAALEPADALLVAAADELHDSATLSPATLDALSDRYDDARLVELVLLCGWYRTLSTLVNAAGLAPEEWAEPIPAPRP
jgi:alkylhydroperoxidase family enzyme